MKRPGNQIIAILSIVIISVVLSYGFFAVKKDIEPHKRPSQFEGYFWQSGGKKQYDLTVSSTISLGSGSFYTRKLTGTLNFRILSKEKDRIISVFPDIPGVFTL